jgi:hypothetical protein
MHGEVFKVLKHKHVRVTPVAGLTEQMMNDVRHACSRRHLNVCSRFYVKRYLAACSRIVVIVDFNVQLHLTRHLLQAHSVGRQ